MSDTQSNQVAAFKTSQTFSIVRRGQVLSGTILKGQIRVGNFIKLVINRQSIYYEITAIEFVDHIGRKEVETGLMFDSASPELRKGLEASLGQAIAIVDRAED